MSSLKTKKYVLLGNPIPLARARHGKYGVWDSQKAIKHSVAQQLMEQHDEQPFFQGPLQMELTFFMPIPAHTPKYLLDSKKNSWHFIKPDCSNIIKFYEDIGLGIIYKDDSIISKISAEKKYDDGNGSRTELIIIEMI